MSATRLKKGTLSLLRGMGTFQLLRDAAWRRRRLLILCYHGVSLCDEHVWRPTLYMTEKVLRARFELLRAGGYVVLPLGEALERLAGGTLPPRSVALTFDDGGYDFYERAYPLLREFGLPATVYLSTYYSEHGVPIFPLACSYLMWKHGGRVEGVEVDGLSSSLDLTTETGHRDALRALTRHAREHRLRDEEKQELARRLAEALELDYEHLLRERIVQLMGPEEVGELARQGVDFQLHTHRHRSPVSELAYREEIRENREAIRRMTGVEPTHFCYPSGCVRPEFEGWLAAEGVLSAVTCRPGLAVTRTNPFRLPRLLDHAGLSAVEIEAWLTGAAELLPRRRYPGPCGGAVSPSAEGIWME
ncbi:MAG: polysaccharide deacetylase family protein [Gemmatimonadota bacterium]